MVEAWSVRQKQKCVAHSSTKTVFTLYATKEGPTEARRTRSIADRSVCNGETMLHRDAKGLRLLVR